MYDAGIKVEKILLNRYIPKVPYNYFLVEEYLDGPRLRSNLEFKDVYIYRRRVIDPNSGVASSLFPIQL